jgi:predicted CxxxxCH...CXXCH cytochrome family protein
MIKILLKYSTVFLAFLVMAACSELVNEIPSLPEINIHGEGVFNSESANYHPHTIAGSPNGMFDCQECHAADFSGGVTGVGCNTPNCHPAIGVHREGIVDPVSDNFHGKYIKNNNWEMRTCQPCHGEKYAGGLVSPTCNDCHTYLGGPENCTTCHGGSTSNAPPKDLNGNTSTSERGVGAHQAHLQENSIGKMLRCTECHNVPGGVYTPGHIDSDNRAEVVMNNPLANLLTNDPSTSEYDPSLPLFEPDPLYNSSTLSCSNTYCHGNFKNGNLNNIVVWTDPASAECGTCHGNATSPLPKTNSEGGSHPGSTNCSICHSGVVDADLNIINPSKHIDGLLNLFGNDIKY